MFQLIIGIFGILVAAVYVGFLAYSIGAIPLWVIVLATFALMIREFIVELRESTNTKRAIQQAGRPKY